MPGDVYAIEARRLETQAEALLEKYWTLIGRAELAWAHNRLARDEERAERETVPRITLGRVNRG